MVILVMERKIGIEIRIGFAVVEEESYENLDKLVSVTINL